MKECLCLDSEEPPTKLISTTSHQIVTTPVPTKYRRGFNHLPEIGNFSQYNEVLKNNKNTLINR